MVFFSLIVSLFFAVPSAWSQNVVRGSSFVVKLGDSDNQLGTLGAGGDDWRPLFFSVAPDRTISIPDYYKQRIARYDQSGRYLDALSTAFVSPRMNYFGQAPDGGYILFNDGVLTKIAFKDAVIVWQAPFPMMVLPGRIVCSDEGVSISLTGAVTSGMGAVFIPVKPPYTASLIKHGDGDRAIPMARAAGLQFAFTVGDARRLVPTMYSGADEAAGLVAIEAGGITWWAKRANSSIGVWKFDKKGLQLRSSFIELDDEESEGFGFVLVPNGSGGAFVYVNGYGKDYVKISMFSVN